MARQLAALMMKRGLLASRSRLAKAAMTTAFAVLQRAT
jgi:hypothetical protein